MKKFVLFFAVMCSLQMMAVSLVVERCSGVDVLQDVAAIGKWVYVGDDLQLLDKAGKVLATESLASIKKIVFADRGSVVENVPANSIVVYPNPTEDILMILGAESQMLRVYDLQGRLLKTEAGKQMSVSDLAEGIYLLQVGTQVVRFIKK